MNYSIGNTEALDTKSSFNIVQAAALIAGIDPAFVDENVHGELKVKRDWDCPCEETRIIRTKTFGNEPSELGNVAQITDYTEAAGKFNQWIDALYEAIESSELAAAIAPKPTPKEPAFFNMPRYADVDAPDPRRTKIKRQDLVDWLTSKGLARGYFFSKEAEGLAVNKVPPYLRETGDFISPKLIAAIRAWEHFSAKGLKTGVHKAVMTWLEQENAAGRLLDDDNQALSKSAREAIAAVVNWNTKGGAPKTPGN
ncbi:hypothetical protein [Noviherbaspirillum sp.]|uniref:hypothetical protein n=1 Tax=Noviherbaspirillum sp. TaxID=1926288 RepID=UPI002FDFAAB5